MTKQSCALKDKETRRVRQKIEAGIKAAKEGRTIPHEEVKRRLLATGKSPKVKIPCPRK